MSTLFGKFSKTIRDCLHHSSLVLPMLMSGDHVDGIQSSKQLEGSNAPGEKALNPVFPQSQVGHRRNGGSCLHTGRKTTASYQAIHDPTAQFICLRQAFCTLQQTGTATHSESVL